MHFRNVAFSSIILVVSVITTSVWSAAPDDPATALPTQKSVAA